MGSLLRRFPILATAFVLALALTLFFGFRVVTGLAGWHHPPDEPIQPWMTVGYVAKSRGLNPREIDAIAGLPMPVDGRPFTLQEIANARGQPVKVVIGQVYDAVDELKGANPPQGPKHRRAPPAVPP